MKYFQVVFRILGFLVGGLVLAAGLIFLLAEGFPQGVSQILLGSMFLAYGVGGNNGNRRFLRVLALPIFIVGLIWFGHGLWAAATQWKVSSMSGEGLIPLRTQPFLFSVVVWGKLVMFAVCSAGLVFAIRSCWLKRKVP